ITILVLSGILFIIIILVVAPKFIITTYLPLPFFEQLHIDHILPEKLLNNPEELEHLKVNYGLREDFDINSYYNWFPVKIKINLQKGGLIYSESNARYYL
ncbi:MAG: hypothetical protein V7K81_21725, partial [Nostoc sp.]